MFQAITVNIVDCCDSVFGEALW